MNIVNQLTQYQRETMLFLHEKLAPQYPDFDGSYFHIVLNKELKEANPATYQCNLDAFRLLFHSGNQHYLVMLWNELVISDVCHFCRADFTPEEWAFLEDVRKIQSLKKKAQSYRHPYLPNVNSPIRTERLTLRGCTLEDIPVFYKRWKRDEGDFISYCGYLPTQSNMRGFSPYYPLKFIIETKDTKEMVGMIGLPYDKDIKTGTLEYFVFREFRNRGYCKEAMQALCNAALSGKLFYPAETVRYEIYGRKKLDIQVIRANVAADNIASIKALEHCGFVYEGTLHKNMYRANSAPVDENYYYMEKK